jgi:4-hydroxy-3-methylbut-2-enyl diphosphate reductase
MKEAVALGKYITGEKPAEGFYTEFEGRYSPGFNIAADLQHFGVINQTTQLATDTQAIADYLKALVEKHFNENDAAGQKRFADTRDTLCYATNDNQTAVREMLQTPADIAFVVGGYNSSNTSHLVELCEEKLPTFYIKEASSIIDAKLVRHYNWRSKEEMTTEGWLPQKQPLQVLLTSGASCPDALVEEVIERLLEFFPGSASIQSAAAQYETAEA